MHAHKATFVPKLPNVFVIAFLVNNEDNDIALLLNARLPQNYLLRNTRLKKLWKSGESASSLPFTLHRGQDFIIQVLITNTAFLISINGYHFASYLHYMSYKLIRKVIVKGQVTNIFIQQMEVQTYPELFTRINNIEIIVSSEMSDSSSANRIAKYETGGRKKWSRSLVARVLRWPDEIPAPYLAAFPRNAMKPGRFLKIEGRVKLLPTAFYINLQKDLYIWPHPIVALHLSPRFVNKNENISKAKIVRCAWYNDGWSPEECSDIETEFLPGKQFGMAIVCVEDAYRIYLNGQFLLEFKYHMRPETVDTISIRGDVTLRWVSLHSTPDDDTFRYWSNTTPTSTERPATVIENSINSRRRSSLITYEY
ncbi:galectin-4-like isoform X2 [Eurosta solidaginis]|uniref:galectin-4-like isoform X2 n=1 Tax=Eurosta solidaginis TaxID=178769 RepID=UPI0035311484